MAHTSVNSENPPIYNAPQEPRTRRFRTFRVVAALILRETGSRETRTSLGFLWQMIDPIATVAVLSFAFGLLMKTPRLGTNFELYYVTGIVPFHMYAQVSSKVASSIRFSRSLLGFPAVTVIDALMARFLLNVFINILVFVALIVGIIWHYQLRISPDIGSIVLSLTMAASVGLGVGTLNSVLFLASPTYESLWAIVTRPMALISGALFLITDLPEYIFKYLKWNPVAMILGEMRHAFYPTFDASFILPGYVFLFSGICLALGLIGLHSYVFDALEK